MTMRTIDIIIPAFNEEETLKETLVRLKNLKKKFKPVLDTNLIFINDGSQDKTLAILKKFSLSNNYIKILSFSRNFGHQIAVSAGLDYSEGDYVAIIDADLQDPPELIFHMYEALIKNQVDVVYGKRVQREGESFFKKITASYFYRILNNLSSVEIPLDTGDFRIITKRVVGYLVKMPEKHRFLRGMIPWVGFKSFAFSYKREKRFAGETKYPLMKMIEFAFTALLSFSSRPLKLVMAFGFFICIFSLFLIIFLVGLKLFTQLFIPGFVSIILAISFFGGINIFILGIIGQYISNIFEEAKGRPLYILDEEINF